MRSLILRDFQNLNDNSEAWSSLQFLEELDLAETPINGGEFRRLASFTALRRLTLTVLEDPSFGYLKNGDLVHIKGLENLEDLTLRTTHFHIPHPGERCLVHLIGHRNLRVLRLPNYRRFTEAAFLSLLTLPKLEKLDLMGFGHEEAVLGHLTPLTNLTALGLKHWHLTEKAFADLKKLPNLRTLDLRECRLTDETMEHIKDLLSLEIVDLRGNKITDASIQFLLKCKKLILVIADPDSFTPSGVRQLNRHGVECKLVPYEITNSKTYEIF